MADVILPDPGTDFEYIIVPKRKELIVQLREKRDVLKAEIDLMIEPSNGELIELGKFAHEYYIKRRELDFIKQQINNLK